MRIGVKYFFQIGADKPMWEHLYPGEKSPKGKVRDFAEKLKTLLVDVDADNIWARSALSQLKKTPLCLMPVAAITPGDIVKNTKTLPEWKKRAVLDGIYRTFRFARTGYLSPSEKKSDGISLSTNGHDNGTSTIKIRQREIISEEEALALIKNSRGKHAQLKEHLQEELAKLPRGKAYAFVPENLSKIPSDRAKEITSLKNALQSSIRILRQPMAMSYISSKNLFIVTWKQTSKTTEQNHVRKASKP